MTVDTGLSDVGKNTPAIEVIRRVLAAHGGTLAIKDLTVELLDAWGRDFPENPYDDFCLVYKLATGVLHCTAKYDAVEGGQPSVARPDEDFEPELLNPQMRFEQLTLLVDDVAEVKVSLPQRLTNSRLRW